MAVSNNLEIDEFCKFHHSGKILVKRKELIQDQFYENHHYSKYHWEFTRSSKVAGKFDLVYLRYPDWEKGLIELGLREDQRKILIDNWHSVIKSSVKNNIPVICESSSGDPKRFDTFAGINLSNVKFVMASKVREMESTLNRLFDSFKKNSAVVLLGGVHLAVFLNGDDVNIDGCVGSQANSLVKYFGNKIKLLIIDPNLCIVHKVQDYDSLSNNLIYWNSKTEHWKIFNSRSYTKLLKQWG